MESAGLPAGRPTTTLPRPTLRAGRHPPAKQPHAARDVALLLLVVGGINRGLMGLADISLVESLFGRATLVTRLVYIVVGIAAAYCAYRLPRWSRLG
ncbi:MAG: DUF378 domain-containing protein [Burkholderiaceae bacterium]